jgi:hypothetical protein
MRKHPRSSKTKPPAHPFSHETVKEQEEKRHRRRKIVPQKPLPFVRSTSAAQGPFGVPKRISAAGKRYLRVPASLRKRFRRFCRRFQDSYFLTRAYLEWSPQVVRRYPGAGRLLSRSSPRVGSRGSWRGYHLPRDKADARRSRPAACCRHGFRPDYPLPQVLGERNSEEAGLEKRSARSGAPRPACEGHRTEPAGGAP